MASAGVMSALQGVLTLTMLSLLMCRVSAATRRVQRSPMVWPTTPTAPSSLPDSCTPDIIDAEAYKIEFPMCSLLAAQYQEKLSGKWCASMQGRPANILLHWGSDTGRAASALLAALLRHVYNLQRVHLAPDHKPFSQFHRPDQLVLDIAAGLKDKYWETVDWMEFYGTSQVPIDRRLHVWLAPAARLNAECQRTNWRFYSNLTALELCGFVVPLPHSFDAVEVLGVGDDSEAEMQRLQRRAKATGRQVRPVFVNRTVFERIKLSAKHSFLFLDFDIWRGGSNVSAVDPPACGNYSDRFGDCEQDLDDFIGMIMGDKFIFKENYELVRLIRDFYPTTEVLRVILGLEANGVNVQEAACEWVYKNKSNVLKEVFQHDNHFNFMKPDVSRTLRASKKYVVATYICIDQKSQLYDFLITSVGKLIFREKPTLNVSFTRYWVNCSDTNGMSRRLDNLMKQSNSVNVLGVVSLTVEGAAAASAVAAAHRVPLLLANVVPHDYVTGNTTWQVAGRLRHIMLALQHFVNQSGWSHIAVLSQPTTFARHYIAELKDNVKISIDNIEIPLNLTDQVAKANLHDLKRKNMRLVFVNADADAAGMILDAAAELNMNYVDGFIWIVRERQNKKKCSTTHFTVSLFGHFLETIPNWFKKLSGDRFNQPWPPQSGSLANALITVSRGFNNIYRQRPDYLTDLHSDQVIRALEGILKESPVSGFSEDKLYFTERAIEKTLVYVDEWRNDQQYHQLATWQVNSTSGFVSDLDGITYGTLGQTIKQDTGVNITVSGQQHMIVTDNASNTSNQVFLVHQWIESITKIVTQKSGVSDIFNKFNLLNNSIWNIDTWI